MLVTDTAKTAARGGDLVAGLPCGHRVPRGELRWYLGQAPEGREQSICQKIRSLVDPEVLDDAFVIFKERWFKQGKEWSIRRFQMYRGYFFVATTDVIELQKQLARLSFPVSLVGAKERAVVPLDVQAQAWFESAMDNTYTIRNSTGVIVDGVLHVQAGPLLGQEDRVRKIDRHRRSCLVDVCPDKGGFSEIVSLNVPYKS